VGDATALQSKQQTDYGAKPQGDNAQASHDNWAPPPFLR